MQAKQPLSPWAWALDHGMDEFTMASATVVLNDRSVTLSDFNRLFEVLKCEGDSVLETSIHFDGPLGQPLGQVAIHAGRRVAVTAFHPPVVVFSHDMAVYAGLGIGREVGQSLRVEKGIPANASRDAESADEEKE
jgi:hypothetical protein